MAYSVHIELDNGEPIHLEDWENVVKSSKDVRLSDLGSLDVTNPHTGDGISRSHRPGDAEIFDEATQEWKPAFSWFKGRISTRAARDFDDANCQLRRVMRGLAALLNARIVGDEDESYI